MPRRNNRRGIPAGPSYLEYYWPLTPIYKSATLLHLLIRVGLGVTAIVLIWVGIDTIRRTREMQRTRGNVRNLLGLKPWYNYFISDDRKREKAIISHNFVAAAVAILAGIGTALILLHDLTGPMAVP